MAAPGSTGDASLEQDAGLPAGENVIAWFFGVLAFSAFAFFAIMMVALELDDPTARPLAWLGAPMVRMLYTPVVAFAAYVAIDARRRGRSGWWLYLLLAPVPGPNVYLSIQWMRTGRHEPRRFGRWTL